MSQRRETSFLAFLLLTLKLLPKSSTGEERTSAWAVITVHFNPFKDLRATNTDSQCLKPENRSSQRKVALSLSAWHLGSVDASLAIPNSEYTHILCSPDNVCFPAGTLGVPYIFRNKSSSFFRMQPLCLHCFNHKIIAKMFM